MIDNLNQSRIIGIDISFFEPAEGDIEFAESLKKSNVVLASEYTSFSIKEGEIFGESILKPTVLYDNPFHKRRAGPVDKRQEARQDTGSRRLAPRHRE